MYTSSTIVAATVLLFIALAAGALYVFGLPREVKRELQERVAETMGENAAKDLLQQGIDRLPEDNRLQTGENILKDVTE